MREFFIMGELTEEQSDFLFNVVDLVQNSTCDSAYKQDKLCEVPAIACQLGIAQEVLVGVVCNAHEQANA